MMLEQVKAGRFSIEKMVQKMSHAPADCFRIRERGYLREGYFADCVIVDLNAQTTVDKSNIHYHCGWSLPEGHTLHCGRYPYFRERPPGV